MAAFGDSSKKDWVALVKLTGPYLQQHPAFPIPVSSITHSACPTSDGLGVGVRSLTRWSPKDISDWKFGQLYYMKTAVGRDDGRTRACFGYIGMICANAEQLRLEVNAFRTNRRSSTSIKWPTGLEEVTDIDSEHDSVCVPVRKAGRSIEELEALLCERKRPAANKKLALMKEDSFKLPSSSNGRQEHRSDTKDDEIARLKAELAVVQATAATAAKQTELIDPVSLNSALENVIKNALQSVLSDMLPGFINDLVTCLQGEVRTVMTGLRAELRTLIRMELTSVLGSLGMLQDRASDYVQNWVNNIPPGFHNVT